MVENYVAYPCPYCSERFLETVATLPYIRGFVLAHLSGHKKFIGCRGCVRKQLLKETGLSCLVGWFSPTALLANPIFIAYGLLRSLLVRTNVDAVRTALKEACIPEPRQEIDLLGIGYSLAAAMIAADRRLDPAELKLASEIGTRLFHGFDEGQFRETVANHRKLPEAAELAALLSGVLDNEGKLTIFSYLRAIACTDGRTAPEEESMLARIAESLQVVFPAAPPLEAAA